MINSLAHLGVPMMMLAVVKTSIGVRLPVILNWRQIVISDASSMYSERREKCHERSM
jgi:hypothetical protein